jgi:hypothetical protein
VDGDVGRLGDHAAAAVEDGARVVLPFLDVDRIRRATQDDAHLVGHPGEQVLEDLQTIRIY